MMINFKYSCLASMAISLLLSTRGAAAIEFNFSHSKPSEVVLVNNGNVASILVETNADLAVQRAVGDLADDFLRVTGEKPTINGKSSDKNKCAIIVGTLGKSSIIDRLATEGKLITNKISGQWESYVLQLVKNPFPGIDCALVVAGSDRRGTIYGIYEISECIGVSPWYWWADVPVKKHDFIAVNGDRFTVGPPAVKYRGIFLNDEDWGLRPWASKTFDPQTGNIGPKTYAKVFELLLRLHANYLWPAMHPGTAAFNSFPENPKLANEYGIVMGSSHCEQMLRNNVSEWDEKKDGDYNFVTNPQGVLKYWEERVRANRKYENIYTLGMRGIHDSGMPGGGSPLEQAQRLETIIADQRQMLARWVNPDVSQVPQIFCPYKEVLPLYRLMTNLPDDITLVWPDDNYGHIREFSNDRERKRSGGAGIYYHISYAGPPRDYLWLCTTPPALIAEETCKAFDYGANRVWMLNVGDLKPAEFDTEFFLKLAWDPHSWNGTNTYDLLGEQIARDFGSNNAPEITAIMAEYYRLNFQRKPEHLNIATGLGLWGVPLPTNNVFSNEEVLTRLASWKNLCARVDAVDRQLPSESRDSFFELVGYPVKVAAAMNAKCLAGSQAAADEVVRLTGAYNNQNAGGKWRFMMSDNPRDQVRFNVTLNPPTANSDSSLASRSASKSQFPGADFVEENKRVIIEAEHASAFVPGKDAHWQKIVGLGYNGESVTVFPTTVATRATPRDILAESPCLEYKVYFQTLGEWTFTVRTLPTLSVETGKPQRYAIAIDDETPHIVTFPRSEYDRDPTWQENMLRNVVLTSSKHKIASAGIHVVKIWMVDPGIVLDAIAGQCGENRDLGYIWPKETRLN